MNAIGSLSSTQDTSVEFTRLSRELTVLDSSKELVALAISSFELLFWTGAKVAWAFCLRHAAPATTRTADYYRIICHVHVLRYHAVRSFLRAQRPKCAAALASLPAVPWLCERGVLAATDVVVRTRRMCAGKMPTLPSAGNVRS
jgi:hypothetical protein